MSISRNRELDALEGGRTRFEAKVKHGECGECVCVCVSNSKCIHSLDNIPYFTSPLLTFTVAFGLAESVAISAS